MSENIKPPLNKLYGRAVQVVGACENDTSLDSKVHKVIQLVTLRNLLSKWWYIVRYWNWRNITGRR